MSEELKPCPFCGSEKVILQGRMYFWVQCKNCLAEIGAQDTEKEAVAQWNRRGMMGRLIDAGLFLDNLSGRLESMKDFDAVKDVINNMPTAYDPDKIVDQLNDKFRVVRTDEDLEWNRAMDEAITIVKGGGVDGN